MGSSKSISLSIRAVAEVEDAEAGAEDEAAFAAEAAEIALCSRSCLISFRDKDLPVPSYLKSLEIYEVLRKNPFTVEDRKTRYGPRRALTRGNGIAAASSITTSSAWPSFCASYCNN